MSRLTPQHWKTLQKVFQKAGFRHNRTAGSHLVMTKPGVPRPVITPMYDEVGRDIIASNLRTAGLSREKYFRLLKGL